jgi:predicted DNA-binding transcriptional regulator YafY
MQKVIERMLNLLAFLLTAGRPVTADEIRNTVHGYDQAGDEAFRRTFERDKDLLRSLGVPLRMEHTDAWEVEQGYVVSPDEYALPDPGLNEEERVALLLASRMVRLGGQAPTPDAILKLGGAAASAGGEPFAADLGEASSVLGLLFAAIVERRILSFDYHDRGRRVRPLGLVHRIGHWYLIGDTADDQRRVFRVDRMSAVATGSKPDAFVRPESFSAADAVAEAPWEAGDKDVEVTVAFDPSVSWWAVRQLTRDAAIVESADGGVEATFPVASASALIGWLIGFDDAAEILRPTELRERLVAHVAGTR